MKRRIVNVLLAACLTAGMAVGSLPAAGLDVKAAADISETVEQGLTVRESEVNQLLTSDLALPNAVEGLEGAAIVYSVDAKDAKYASVEGNKLRVTRPYAGEEDYKFNLKAKVTSAEGAVYEKSIPLTIRAGLSEDSYAGYVYVCFSVPKGKDYDVQQIHFFLSEDGLNWTALNGCNPIFETGKDYIDKIERCAPNSVNYKVASGTDLSQTVKGDASVLFPFEGRDQGVRDPYLIRGSRKDGSDSNKVWLLATDLNTHSEHYGGKKETNTLGSWGLTSTVGKGSQKIFVWETEDWVHWERRYIDVGKEVNSAMAWAPEAIYNPEKDNYLVYWSARVDADGASRDRLYCNETKDFKTFGPTKLYEAEPYYEKYKPNGRANNSGYGNIDTSQLWVAGKDADGKDTPYGTLYRVVKDETNNHIELMKANTVLDPQMNYDESDPIKIKPYPLGEKTFAAKGDLDNIPGESNEIKRAEIVHNWFIDQSVGNHFEKISQEHIEGLTGTYEGATMFKFIDRDEWCVMIDFYGNMQVRYEPYVTTDLSNPDSVQKMPEGTYGRTGGDVGTHGGMIPITVKEYNAMIDAYNADPTVSNYHEIDPISVDMSIDTVKKADEMEKKLQTASGDSSYSAGVRDQMKNLIQQMRNLVTRRDSNGAKMDKLVSRGNVLLANKPVSVPNFEAKSESVFLDEEELTLCTKATEGLKTSAKLQAEASIDSDTPKITYTSSNPAVADVSAAGAVTAKKQGSAMITATAPGGAKAVCKVTVKGVPNKVTPNKKKVTLKKGRTFQLRMKIPAGTVCSKFNYKSNKPKIAAVTKTGGKITAKKKGTAKITVTASNNKKAKATITVKVK